MALETSPQAPAPVRQVAQAVAGWIDRLGIVWVEGQVAQVNRRAGVGKVFLTLRDSVADISVPVTCPRAVFDALGELLARLERRRQLLAAEGLFAPELKRRLPFLPGCVGLVTSPDSAAERDVVENARRRWPAVVVETAYAAMQGTRAAGEVIAA